MGTGRGGDLAGFHQLLEATKIAARLDAGADRCMEIHGGMGLATDLPIEKFWRDQRSMMITEGPIEILKMTLARHVLRTYG